VTAAAVAGHAGDEPAADSGLAVPLAEALGVKCVTVYPGAEGLPAVMGDDMLLDGTTGLPQALIDGPAPAARRTAAASALATGDLARGDVRALTMVGGALAPHPVRAHATVRPTEAVSIWGWSKDEARASADALRGKLCGSFGGKQIIVQATDDLERVARSAGVISCATMSRDPLVRDDWIEPGRHRILASGFTPETRETDDASIACAHVYVDTRVGARMAA
ncbi:MAG: hypothetical protein OEQ29_14620, partial [Alphaproteobacteria bacterium]|nr:hypothetical protein [Alphaproteobacteria bacterium]